MVAKISTGFSILPYFCLQMQPDYPHKIFVDERTNYNLLMERLAMDAAHY
jgi:hypothetical protein